MEDIGVSSGRPEVGRPEGSTVFGLARVLLVLERPALAELIALTLNHRVYTTRAVAIASEVETTVAE